MAAMRDRPPAASCAAAGGPAAPAAAALLNLVVAAGAPDARAGAAGCLCCRQAHITLITACLWRLARCLATDSLRIWAKEPAAVATQGHHCSQKACQPRLLCRLQVTVAVVRYESLQRQRIGVTSTYLAERLAVRSALLAKQT